MTTPALARREGQPVPTTAEDAAAKFTCQAYRCTMEGKRCRDEHVRARELKPMNRDACIDCPSGGARAILLGDGAGEAGRASICREKTAKGQPCSHPPVSDGLCHIHRPRGAKKDVEMKNKAPVVTVPKPKVAALEKTPAPAPVQAPKVTKKAAAPAPEVEKVQAAPAAPPAQAAPAAVAPPAPPPAAPATPAPEAVLAPAAPPADVPCIRVDCGRPAHTAGRLSEFCRNCGNSAYMTLKKGLKRVPTDDERRDWLLKTPANVNWRTIRERRLAGAAAPAVPAPSPRASKYHSAGIDWDKVPLGKLTDTELGEQLGVSSTAVRHQRKRRGIAPVITSPSKSKTFVNRKRMQRHKARALVSEFLCTTLGAKLAPGFSLVEAGQADWAFCILTDQDRLSYIRPDRSIEWNGTAWVPGADDAAARSPLPAAEVEKEPIDEQAAEVVEPAGPAPEAEVLVPAAIPDHLVEVSFRLNRRAFAELERMAAAGLHGDDPADVARTLVLGGLRAFSAHGVMP